MASLTKKIIRGRPYYYLRESQRIQGKPKIIWTKYLGPAEKLADLLLKTQEPAPPDETTVLSFGAVALAYAVAEDLDLPALIDARLPKRRQGYKFSDFLLVSAINRAIQAKSKSQMKDWISKTALPKIMNLGDLSGMTPQHFWNHADVIAEEQIDTLVAEIRNRCVERFDIPLDFLQYDTTNYFTYLSTFNARSRLARRGHNKQKRDDLRQVGWALVVSEKHHLPLFQKVYPGHLNDFSQFRVLLPELSALASKGKTVRTTYVFDAGNWSETNARALGVAKLDFITTLKPKDHGDLFTIPTDEKHFQALEDREGVLVHRTTKALYGKEQTVLVVWSQVYFDQELKTYLAQKNRAQKKLKDLKKRLENTASLKNNPPRSLALIQEELRKILSPVYLKKCFSVEVMFQDTYPQITYRYISKAFQAFIAQYCGKELIATSRKDLSSEQIVGAKYHQSHIEHEFKITKDRSLGGWWPMHHWTDQQIRVHGLCCYLALLILAVARMRLGEHQVKAGIHSLITDILGSIYRLDYHYRNKKGQTRTVSHLSKMDPTQAKIVEIFQLKKYL